MITSEKNEFHPFRVEYYKCAENESRLIYLGLHKFDIYLHACVFMASETLIMINKTTLPTNLTVSKNNPMHKSYSKHLTLENEYPS